MHVVNRVLTGVSCAALLAMSGCAQLGLRRGLSDERKAQMHKVVVASNLGSHFFSTFTGTTVFNNTEDDVELPQWGLDDLVAQTALGALQAAGRQGATRVDVIDAKDRGLTEARRLGADTLVYIERTGYSNQPTFRSPMGYNRRDFMGLGGPACLYTLFVVEAIDVRSGEEVAWQWGFPSMAGIPCTPTVAWKPHFNDYTDEEKAALKSAVQNSVRANVYHGLQQLGVL